MLTHFRAWLFGATVTIHGPDGAIATIIHVSPGWRRWLGRWL